MLASADSLANTEITLEGVCTHTCKHGATKIFLMGSDDTKTIRVDAGSLGSFDQKCVNSIVRVKGILKEERIDEAYLQRWEASAAANTEEHHGDGALLRLALASASDLKSLTLLHTITRRTILQKVPYHTLTCSMCL